MSGISIHAIHYRILDAVKAAIEEARLTGAPRVQIEKHFQSRTHFDPNTIYVSRAAEQQAGGTFGSDTIAYPAVLFMTRGSGGGSRENEEVISDWRSRVHDLFALKRGPISNLDLERVCPIICRVDFGSDLLEDFWRKRWDCSHMVILAVVRKAR